MNRHAVLVAAALTLAREGAAQADESLSIASPSQTRAATEADARAESLRKKFGKYEIYVGGLAGSAWNLPSVSGLETSGGKGTAPLSIPTLGSDTFASHGGAAFGLDLQFTMRTHAALILPLIGARALFVASSGDDTQTFSDGTNRATLSIHPTSMFEIAGPGLGVEFLRHDWLARATVQPVLQLYTMSGSLTQGYVPIDVSAHSAGFGLDASLEVCTRSTLFSALCLSASPLLWRSDQPASSAVNGLLVGFGWRGIGE